MKGPAVMFSNRRASLAAIEKGPASAKHHRAFIFHGQNKGEEPSRVSPLYRLDLFRPMTDKACADQRDADLRNANGFPEEPSTMRFYRHQTDRASLSVLS